MKLVSKLAYYGRVLANMHVWKNPRLAYLPEYVALEVTNVCNFRCSFCPQSDPAHHDKVPRSYLDAEKCRLYLAKIREAGITTDLMHWTLDGEPFMNKRFAELVRVSAEFGFVNTFFASNGTFCTVDRLVEFPLDAVSLNIAIDYCADPEYFEEVRGTKGSWETVRENIDAVLHDPRTSGVRIELTDISSFSQTDPRKLKASYEALKQLFGQHPNLHFRTRTFHNATGFLARKFQRKKYHVCPYPFHNLRIASNGEVVICSRDLDHKTVLGNLNDQSVAEIWNGDLWVEARRNLLQKNPEGNAACKECDLPYDSSKFSLRNVYRAARGRLQLFAALRRR